MVVKIYFFFCPHDLSDPYVKVSLHDSGNLVDVKQTSIVRKVRYKKNYHDLLFKRFFFFFLHLIHANNYKN